MVIHPDDVLLFTEVSAAMRRVAKIYNLPLRSITGLPMPSVGYADHMGDCSGSGEIRIALRCTENGQWCEAPLPPQTVWDIAAHELAHLRHMDHGDAFQDFCEELQVAMNNQQVDHKQKVLDKLIKLQAARNSEAELGNSEAAEAFAGMINKMLLEHELNPSDLEYARATDRDPVIEVPVNFGAHKMKPAKVRVAWQERLASIVANAHLCKFLVRLHSNQIIFVGTKSHAVVAEYVYGTMVPLIEKMSKKAEVKYWHETGCGRGENNAAKGYRSAWIDSFITRIFQRFEEAKKAAIQSTTVLSSSTGLMRLDGALVKAQTYIDDKFSGRAVKSAGALNFRSRNHEDGRAAGREAANSIVLGQRGLNNGANRKLIGN